MNSIRPYTSSPPPPSDYGLRGSYQLADSTLTLREGLLEYYRVNPELIDPSALCDEPSAEFFHNHDCTHVMFGTHTGKLDEVANDLLTLFCVDIRIDEYYSAFMATNEFKVFAKNYTASTVLDTIRYAARLLPICWRRGRRMTRRWPWSPPEAFLDRRIDELRAEFGIKVLRPNVELGFGAQTHVEG